MVAENTVVGRGLLPFQTDAGPTTLFLEDWESYSGISQSNSVFYTGSNYSWNFETSEQNKGRIRWGNNTFQSNSGNGAVTLDRTFQFGGNDVTNFALLTIDLSAYSESEELFLSFSWADHNDEEQGNDKVWVRGSNNDSWLEIYDLNPESSQDNTYQTVSGLDIDQVLNSASPPQSITSSFQLRFGQEDNYPTSWDGISFDDIVIMDLSVPDVCENPSGLTASNIETNSVGLTWIENGDATVWEIRLLTTGSDTSNIPPITVNSNFHTWTNLLAATSYDWYVRAICENGSYSDWIGPATFETDCNTYTVPYYENFDGLTEPLLPTCWTAIADDPLAFIGTSDTTSFSPPNSVVLYNQPTFIRIYCSSNSRVQ